MIQVKHLRHGLKRRLSWARVPILDGPLKGSWFGLFTGSRFIRGTYGRHETATFQRLLKAGDVVFDIGAHVGYFTLLASNLVRSRGRVFAFEPMPLNLTYLHQHVRSNRVTNVKVLPFAVGRTAGRVPFKSAGGSGRGRLSADTAPSQFDVQVVSLDQLFEQRRLPAPDLIKIDIEGVEGEALQGATNLIAQHRPKILLSLHGLAAKQDSESLLKRHGYQLSHLDASTIIALPCAA